MKACTWEGCSTPIKPHRRGRFCNKHYAQKRRRDAGIPPRVFGRKPCSYLGCDKPHKAKGYCSSHYGSLYHTQAGRPRADRPAPAPPREMMGVWDEGPDVTVVHWRRRDQPWACPVCEVKVL